MKPFPHTPGLILPAAQAIAAAMLAVPLALMLVASQFFHTNTLRFAGFSLAGALDGTIPRPYAFRVMTAWLVDLALWCGLQHIRLPVVTNAVTANCPAITALSATSCDQAKAYAAVSLICAWGFLVGTYFAALRTVGGALWGFAAIALAALTVNAILLTGYGHHYDFPVLLTATMLFILALGQRDRGFLVAFAVAMLVKESLVLFALVYALIGTGERSRPRVAGNFIAHIFVFAAIYGWERLHFARNGGQPVYRYWDEHLHYLLDNTSLPALVTLLSVCALLFYGLRDKNPALRRSMLVLPIMVLLYFAGGNPGEFRIVFDVFPIALLPVLDTLKRISDA